MGTPFTLKKTCKIFNKGRTSQVVAKIKMEKNRSFPLTFRYAKNATLKMYVVDEPLLWHRRFGHLNFQSLRNLQQKKMVYVRGEKKKSTTEIDQQNRTDQFLSISGPPSVGSGRFMTFTGFGFGSVQEKKDRTVPIAIIYINI